MNIYCSLRIKAGQKWEVINKIMNFNTDHKMSNIWMLDIEASESNSYPKILNQFIDLIEAKFTSLNQNGVTKDDVSIWLLVESDGEEQNNLEFDTELLKRLSANIRSFCISNWVG